MKVFLTPRARADLRAIHKYLRAKSLRGAENVLRRIRGALLQLEDQPEIGMAVADTDVRRLYVGRYPYLAYYRLTGSRVDVLHVRHTSRADVEAADLE